ncbi:MAG: hypothetical protein J7647_04450 [Cyanobacteria bacterium SBLK]|nr:hypothetical protein [Cyanobacteria bacterium SBLK]
MFLNYDCFSAELAAELWARERLRGQPTADEKSLDIDTIIMAHWQLFADSFPGRNVVIATTNIRHLSLFAEAKEWQDIG